MSCTFLGSTSTLGFTIWVSGLGVHAVWPEFYNSRFKAELKFRMLSFLYVGGKDDRHIAPRNRRHKTLPIPKITCLSNVVGNRLTMECLRLPDAVGPKRRFPRPEEYAS